MSAQIHRLYSDEDYLWRRVKTDLDAYFRGEMSEAISKSMEGGNIGICVTTGLSHLVPNVKACWADARKRKAELDQEKLEKAGA